MATIRLIPSAYAVSSTSYLSVSNPTRMYDNTDSTDYATITNTNASTSSRYLYLRGFNFDDIPAGATINSFTVKIKGYESGLSTSTSYAPRLANGTSALSNTTASSNFGTSASTITIPTGALTWNQIVNYGSNFTILVYVRRNSRNTTGYFYCYGAEIEVDYTAAVPAVVTTTLSGNGTVTPLGTTQLNEGDEFSMVIEPDNASDTVSATKDGVDITSQLVLHSGGSQSASTVLGEYNLVSGSFNSGESYFEGIVGNGVDAEKTTNNYYSSSSSTRAVFTYALSFDDIPPDAVITRLYCQVNGHAESTSNSNEYMCVQLKSGNTDLCEQENFKSYGTSNTTITLEADTLPTVAQLADLVLECTLGYYGGAINGATCYVEYTVASSYYTYDFIVTGDTVIAVVIGSAMPFRVKSNGAWATPQKVLVKQNGAWVQASKVLVKQNGSWQ